MPTRRWQYRLILPASFARRQLTNDRLSVIFEGEGGQCDGRTDPFRVGGGHHHRELAATPQATDTGGGEPLSSQKLKVGFGWPTFGQSSADEKQQIQIEYSL